jgi:twitching motility protein PilI
MSEEANPAAPADDARAVRLRDFSEQIAARLQAAPAPQAAPARLAVRIGEQACLLDMASAGEIVATPPISPVPWTRPWFLGLANIRGRLVGVIDLSTLGGGMPIAAEQGLQLVVCSEALKLNLALLITRAFGLRNPRELQPLGPVNDPARPWERDAYLDANGTRLVDIDLQALVAFEDFLHIGLPG